MEGRHFDVLKRFITSGPNGSGEYKARCPLHKNGRESRPSATFNFEKGLYHCNAGCGGGKIASLVSYVESHMQDEANVEKAEYDPFLDNVREIEDKRAEKRGEKRDKISVGLVKGWHSVLMGRDDLLEEFCYRRGLTVETIKQFEIGYETRSQRYTIPIYDADGNLVNIRRYKPDAEAADKMWNMRGHGSPPRLFPIQELAHDEVLVVEGELDALVAIQHGFHAVSGTGGSQRWSTEWKHLFEGKHVSISYDNDKEGRVGAKKVLRSLSPVAASATILGPLTDEVKSDITDFFKNGGTAEQLRQRMADAKLAADRPPDQPEPTVAAPESGSGGSARMVPVIGSMDSRTNGQKLGMSVTIVGKRNPTYSVPAVADMSCSLDAGPKCKVCPMAQEWEGDHVARIDKHDVSTLARFIDANEDKVLELLRKHIGAAKCNRLTHTLRESHTIEELFVTGSVDRRSVEGHDYTQRRVYNVGAHDTPTNTTANVEGTTWPSPKDRRNEFFSWDLREAQTSIDAFGMTEDRKQRLSVFQPAEGQRPIEKAREIAQDMSQNVTRILGRERLHMAMDLVWHSILHFPFDGKIISRGWLEFIVVGDTRTGKSETAIRLADHYGLGHVIGCEGATFAGLVGAVKQIGDAWTVTWGEITINDRRLVVLDEASGLSQDIIGQLSDVRSRGIAQLTKVESQETRARTRMVWISNPRKSRFVDEKKHDGIDILEDLIGNPEDIARFDFAMSVSMNDVSSEVINNPHQIIGEPKYSSDACNELVLWAWSRRPEHVEFKPEATNAIYEAAEWLGGRYYDHPPLIQRTNVREKIARLSVALAARTFSTDDSGEMVIIHKEHVVDAVRFLHKLYTYDNFGYFRLSKRIARNRKIAQGKRKEIKRWLMENPRLLEFLMDRRGSFRSQDLEEMAHLDRDEVSNMVGKLADAKMVSKDKSQIVVEPELHSILKEIDI